MTLLSLLLATAFPTGVTQAAPGDLDTSFGSDGQLITLGLAGFRFAEAFGVVVQPDGKIIAAGYADNAVGVGGASFALARYNTDGSLDSGFGLGGLVKTPFAATGIGRDIALQSDGKIVVVGRVSSFVSSDFALARYNPDGSLDPGFGVGGKVTTDLGSSSFDEEARAVAIQPDGAIIVAGASGSRTVVVRYTSSGSLDAGFGSGGMVSVDFPVLQLFQGVDLALQPDGKIVVVGQKLSAVARLNSDGTFDSGFGSGGKVTASFGPAMDDRAAAVALQPDGKIVVAGDAGSATGRDFALARYDVDGSLDVGFGSTGLVTTDLSSADDRALDLVLQADGKIVAAGFAFRETIGNLVSANDFALARYQADGTLDDSFGSGGKVTTSFGGVDVTAEAHAVALQPDGRIVAAGAVLRPFSGGSGTFALARYLDGAAEALAVAIDIKPGSETNPINLQSKGVITVAILSTGDFSAISVDPLSVRFGPAGATAIRGRGHFEDVDGGRNLDLVLHFRTQDTGVAHGDTEACLTGKTLDGVQIRGCDVVRVR